jgi:hypothetical protein
VNNKKTNNFIVCVLPEYGLKIDYPMTWQIVNNKAFLHNNIVVGFGIPKENPTDLSFDSLCVYALDIPGNYSISLDEFIDLIIRELKETCPRFYLIESNPTTLGGVSAHQIAFTETGQKKLGVYAIKRGRVYIISYGARSERYLKNLSTVEQMIASFEFLC